MKHGKAYNKSAAIIDKDNLYSPLAAARLAKAGATSSKFDQTVEVAMLLGVDPRKADQMVRSTVNLPHGTGKTARVLVIAAGEKADEARAAGADYVGAHTQGDAGHSAPVFLLRFFAMASYLSFGPSLLLNP